MGKSNCYSTELRKKFGKKSKENVNHYLDNYRNRIKSFSFGAKFIKNKPYCNKNPLKYKPIVYLLNSFSNNILKSINLENQKLNEPLAIWYIEKEVIEENGERKIKIKLKFLEKMSSLINEAANIYLISIKNLFRKSDLDYDEIIKKINDGIENKIDWNNKEVTNTYLGPVKNEIELVLNTNTPNDYYNYLLVFEMKGIVYSASEIFKAMTDKQFSQRSKKSEHLYVLLKNGKYMRFLYHLNVMLKDINNFNDKFNYELQIKNHTSLIAFDKKNYDINEETVDKKNKLKHLKELINIIINGDNIKDCNTSPVPNSFKENTAKSLTKYNDNEQVDQDLNQENPNNQLDLQTPETNRDTKLLYPKNNTSNLEFNKLQYNMNIDTNTSSQELNKPNFENKNQAIPTCENLQDSTMNKSNLMFDTTLHVNCQNQSTSSFNLESKLLSNATPETNLSNLMNCLDAKNDLTDYYDYGNSFYAQPTNFLSNDFLDLNFKNQSINNPNFKNNCGWNTPRGNNLSKSTKNELNLMLDTTLDVNRQNQSTSSFNLESKLLSNATPETNLSNLMNCLDAKNDLTDYYDYGNSFYAQPTNFLSNDFLDLNFKNQSINNPNFKNNCGWNTPRGNNLSNSTMNELDLMFDTTLDDNNQNQSTSSINLESKWVSIAPPETNLSNLINDLNMRNDQNVNCNYGNFFSSQPTNFLSNDFLDLNFKNQSINNPNFKNNCGWNAPRGNNLSNSTMNELDLMFDSTLDDNNRNQSASSINLESKWVSIAPPETNLSNLINDLNMRNDQNVNCNYGNFFSSQPTNFLSNDFLDINFKNQSINNPNFKNNCGWNAPRGNNLSNSTMNELDLMFDTTLDDNNRNQSTSSFNFRNNCESMMP